MANIYDSVVIAAGISPNRCMRFR